METSTVQLAAQLNTDLPPSKSLQNLLLLRCVA